MSDTAIPVLEPTVASPIPRVGSGRGRPKRNRLDVRGTTATAAGADQPRMVREEVGIEQVTRKSRGERTLDLMDIPQRCKKPGIDYQYIVITVLGQPVERADLATWSNDGGWRPVLAKDMPGLLAAGDTSQYIEQRGQRLMFRPMHLTAQARQEDYNEAERVRLDRIEGARSGRSNHGDGLDNVRGVVPVGLRFDIEQEVGAYTSSPLQKGA